MNKDHELAYQSITDWITREHTLISSRMTWLLATNSFLIIPIGSMLNDGKLSCSELLFALFIALLGIVFSTMIGRLIRGAIATIDYLRKSERKLYKKIEREEERKGVIVNFINPDFDHPNRPSRPESEHDKAMCLEGWIPKVWVIAWSLLFISLVAHAANTLG